MDGNYWLVEFDGPEGPDFGCVYAFSVSDAKRSAKREYGNKNVRKDPEAVEFTWFHYEPLLVPSRKVNGREVASLKDQFFAGGRIGCEASGLEIMFTPDLFPEALEIQEGDEERTVYGSASIRVKGRPDLDDFIEIEGLDDAHLIDRLSSEATRIVGRSRLPEAPRAGRTGDHFPDRKPGERIETYERLVAAVRKFAAQETRGSILASLPDETEAEAELRLATLPSELSGTLRNLDRLAPFERTAGDGIWETLVVDTADGNAWIGVVNAAGRKDRVTTFGAEPDCSFQFDQWCLCREDSPMGGPKGAPRRDVRRRADGHRSRGELRHRRPDWRGMPGALYMRGTPALRLCRLLRSGTGRNGRGIPQGGLEGRGGQGFRNRKDARGQQRGRTRRAVEEAVAAAFSESRPISGTQTLRRSLTVVHFRNFLANDGRRFPDFGLKIAAQLFTLALQECERQSLPDKGNVARYPDFLNPASRPPDLFEGDALRSQITSYVGEHAREGTVRTQRIANSHEPVEGHVTFDHSLHIGEQVRSALAANFQ